MKSRELARYVPPMPPPPPSCQSCRVLAPDCLLPDGHGSIDLCWICAHQIVEHGHELGRAAAKARCSCTPHEIYPSDTAAEHVGIQR